jgi:hypothetical protein
LKFKQEVEDAFSEVGIADPFVFDFGLKGLVAAEGR